MRDARRAGRRNQGSIPARAAPGTPRVLSFARSVLVLNLMALIGLIIRLAPGASFRWMVVLAYALLILVGVELWFEPLVRKFRWGSCSALLLAAVWFSIAIPFSSAPLSLVAYSPPGDYPPGTPVGGIPWDPHFAELRIGITNPTDADYQGLDLLLKPCCWVRQASILDNAPGCTLSEVGGGDILSMATASKSGKLTVMATPVGTGLDLYDSGGNAYTTVATDAGYRLRCDRFPSHYSVKIIFAAVTVLPALAQLAPRPKPGQRGMSIAELSGAKRPSDVFGPKPSPSEILVKGHYRRGIKPRSVDRILKVETTADN
jgi:hypothetical protein